MNREADPAVALLSYTAPATNLAMFLTGVPTCLKFVRQRGVGSKQPGPFLVGSLCCAAWFKYGLIVGDEAVYRVNALGLALHLGYVSCYAAYASKPARRFVAKISIGMSVAFFSFLAWLSFLRTVDPASERSLSGLACAALSVCFAASSMDALRTVLRERSTQSLQLPFISAVFLVTVQWSLYGHLAGDAFVCYPNAAAAAVAAAQLGLFCVYPTSEAPPPQTSSDSLPLLQRAEGGSAVV